MPLLTLLREFAVVFLGLFLLSWGQVCNLYLSQSDIPFAGRGIFAGRDYFEGDVIIDSNFIVIPSSVAMGSQLVNYVHETGHDNYDLLVLNFAALLNHGEAPNVDHYWSDADLSTAGLGDWNDGNFLKAKYSIQFIATRTIHAGEEILTTYGDSDWFLDRFGESFNRSHQEYIASNFQIECLDRLYVDNSRVAGIGKGLFSGLEFQPGDIITAEPVVAFPSENLREHGHCLFVNYCYWSNESAIALLPLGLLWSINHADLPNSHLQFTEDSIELIRALSSDDLLAQSYSSVSMKLIAGSTINIGDEITINYGDNWGELWSLYNSNGFLNVENYFKISNEAIPPFRHHIQPYDLFESLHFVH